MTEPLIPSNAWMLLISFSIFPALAGLMWLVERIKQRLNAHPPRSQATRGLTLPERQRRQAALHLEAKREQAIRDLGTAWVLHPDHKAEKKVPADAIGHWD